MKTRRTTLVATLALLLSATTIRAQECININTAQADEIRRLPHVGRVMAARIIEHRHKHGPFKRPQEIIVIRGLSAKHYRQIAHLICSIH